MEPAAVAREVVSSTTSPAQGFQGYFPPVVSRGSGVMAVYPVRWRRCTSDLPTRTGSKKQMQNEIAGRSRTTTTRPSHGSHSKPYARSYDRSVGHLWQLDLPTRAQKRKKKRQHTAAVNQDKITVQSNAITAS